ncbi:MAG TPA: NADH-quinone oxidoreductase subunit N [Gemmatimonadales bacterium]|nr:NADH-quinone oxidoreductase subunit N [Gemmatimonadales bacterium]
MEIDLSTPFGVSVALLPELLLSAWALLVVLLVAWRHRTPGDARLAGWLSLPGLILAAAALGWLARTGVHPAGPSLMVSLDGYRYAAGLLIVACAAAAVLLSIPYLEREGITAPEFYPLVLLATVGMLAMVAASDLIVFFLGLETMSVAIYVLAGYDRRSAFSAEAALKYFLIGAFASGFLLYGIALTYGAAGTTDLSFIGAQLGSARISVMAGIGLALILVGFAFKVAAVPFHMWAPDVYDGAPTTVTTFMATAVKAAAFLALVRVLVVAFPTAADDWRPVVAALAVATMIFGNLVALVQRSLKRMLAYSAIAHAGYLLVAVHAQTVAGPGAVWLYLAAYAVTTIASFGFLAALGRGGERDVTLDRIAGLASERPGVALGLAISMLSLLGFPGTFGFIGKWNILMTSVGEGSVVLPVVLVLTSVISAGYYLPVIMAMYMKPAPRAGAYTEVRTGWVAGVVLTVSVAVIVGLGVLPAGALHTTEGVAATLPPPPVTQPGPQP